MFLCIALCMEWIYRQSTMLFTWIILLLIIDLVNTDPIVYRTNNTETVCMAYQADMEFKGVIFVKKNNSNVFVVISLSTNTFMERIFNITLNRNIGRISFCIENTTITDSGTYSIYHGTDTMNLTLYVLGKPEKPKIIIVNNGTVGGPKGVLNCSSVSTSRPDGLKLTFSWEVNGKAITNNSKYLLKDESHICLEIATYRNESLYRYSCRAKEEYGQTSEQSIQQRIEPYRKPLLPGVVFYNVIRNHSLSLNCTIEDSFPPPSNYTWYKSDVLIANNKSALLLNNIEITEAGDYECNAFNLIGNGTSVMKVDVLYGPFIFPIPTQSQEMGFDIKIKCNVSSNPHLHDESISWSRKGDEKFIKIGRLLSITNLRIEDEDIYTCRANLSFVPSNGQVMQNESSVSFHLKVLYGPIISLQQTYKQIENRSLILRCNVTSSPNVNDSTIVWTKEGLNYSVGPYLRIFSVNRKDSGRYNCSAEITLFVSVGPPVERIATKAVDIDILYGPEITMEKEFQQIEGKVVNITCKIDSNPVPLNDDIRWIRNGFRIHKGRNLIIPAVTRQQSGEYSCSVLINLYPTDGIPDESSKQDSINVDVLYGPVVETYSATTVEEGESLEVTCNSTSNPKATNDSIVWIKVGNSSFGEKGLHLSFNPISRKDIGYFVCIVNIELVPTYGLPVEKNASGTITVTVKYQPVIYNITSVTTFEGNRTQINCSADGNPVPSFIWTYVENGSVINEHDRFEDKYISTSSILLPSARCEDTGTYMCLASNNIRSPSNKTASVAVNCKPRLGHSGNLNVTIGKNETLNLTITFHAVPQPTFTWSFNNSNLRNFNVSSLNGSLPYQFGSRLVKSDFGELNIGRYTIQATNEIGSAYEEINILYQQEPFKPNFTYLDCKEKPGSAKVAWKSAWNGGLPQHFTILYKLSENLFFSESMQYSENEGIDEYTEFVYNLRKNANYIFRIKTRNDVGEEESQDRSCKVPEDIEEVSVLPIAGSISGSIAGLLAVAVVFLVYKRRKISNATKEQIKRGTPGNDDNDEGLKDNPLYVYSGSIGAHRIRNTKDGNIQQIEDGKDKEKKRGKKHTDDVYENAQDIVKIREGPFYGNVDDTNLSMMNSACETRKNKDGLVYAELEFNTSVSKFVIHGIENKSVYADIDLTKQAEPLPSDNDEETNQK